MKIHWTGIYPALTTKFHADGRVDLPLFARNLEAQLAAGVEGVILGGSLGEASTLTLEDKQLLVRQSLDVCRGKVPVLLNVAESSTVEAQHLVKTAEAWGVDGFMILPPLKYKADDRETVTYFKHVAGVTGKPFMIYNNPFDYKIEVTIPMFAELAAVPNIQAVKESSRDITNITRMRNAFEDRFAILGGVDTLSLESLVTGADGLVAGLVCAFPQETVAIYKLVKQGRLAEALAIYRWFMPLLELDIHPKLVQYIKLAESEVGLGSELVREPRLPLQGEERARILKIIRDGIATRPVLPRL